jgi:hypothetical protein
MAQVVIFAPEGEDVSAGEQALKDAGHDVEVIEATAENLLHMAVGMIEHKSADKEDEAEPAAEEPMGEEPPAEETPPEAADEAPPAKMEALQDCDFDGVALASKIGRKTRLFVKELKGGDRNTIVINESAFSFWGNTMSVWLKMPDGVTSSVTVPVYQSRFGATYLEVGPDLHAHF